MFETTDDDLECMTEGEEYSERQERALIRNNHWYCWRHDINNKCCQHFETESKNVNAFYVQEVNFKMKYNYFLSDCSHFGRNRYPETSSPVENEFNKIKHAIMLDKVK